MVGPQAVGCWLGESYCWGGPRRPHPSTWRTDLPFRDADWLSEHNPGDALTQRGCGQGAGVGPVVPAGRQEAVGLEAGELGLGALHRVGNPEISTDLPLGPDPQPPYLFLSGGSRLLLGSWMQIVGKCL